MKLIDRAVQKMPVQTRVHVLEEGRFNPGFWKYFTPLATRPEPGAAIDDEMKMAAINEIDPSKYKWTRGRWPVLRGKIRTIRRHIEANAYILKTGTVGDIPGMVTSLDQPSTTSTASSSSGGTDIWGTIGKVLSTVGTAAGSIYTAKIAADAATKVAQTQQQAQQNVYATQAQQQAALQQAQQLAQRGGSSNTVLYILLGLLGLGGLVLLFQLLKKR